jgi:hypothetical protein
VKYRGLLRCLWAANAADRYMLHFLYEAQQCAGYHCVTAICRCLDYWPVQYA